MTAEESLKRLGTIAFSCEVMQNTIKLGLEGARTIECGAWLALVPEVYLWDALTAANDVMAYMLKGDSTPKATEETRLEFISRLSAEVFHIPPQRVPSEA